MSYTESIWKGFPALWWTTDPLDRTAELASAAGAMVERHASNRGKSAAMNTAFMAAKQRSAQALVIMDGDWQHDPREIAGADRSDRARAGRHRPWLAISSRAPGPDTCRSAFWSAGRHGRGKCRVRPPGERLSKWLSSILSVGDRPALFRTNGFTVESEIQFLEELYGLRHAEVPISVNYDDPPKAKCLFAGTVGI